MPEGQPRRNPAFNQKVSTVQRPVMRTAETNQVIDIMAAALGSWIDVMHIDERRVTATGHHAAPAIATQNPAPDGGRDRLLGA
jgi:hypothetical protein